MTDSQRALTESPMMDRHAPREESAVPRFPAGAPLRRLAMLAAVLVFIPFAFTNAFHYDIATKIAMNRPGFAGGYFV